MTIAVLGIDLGKNTCSVAGLDETGRVVLRRRLTRDGVVRLAAGLPACVVAMEACCGAHHLGRVMREQGHEVRLMSPEYVQPYVKAQKNDERDAEAIAEAATRPTMRFVELKSEAQLDMQILHRARTRLVSERTALINQLRAVLLERGIVVAKGRRRLEEHLKLMLADHAEPPATLSPAPAFLIEDMRLEWGELDRALAALSAEFVMRARGRPGGRRLATIPAFGALNATGARRRDWHGRDLRSGRDPLPPWLGLVPKQATTGGKPRLLGTHQAGQHLPAHALIHGARAALPSLLPSQSPMGEWLRGLIARAHKNKVVVALAGKPGPDRMGGPAFGRQLREGRRPAMA
jgi:transposase